MDKDATIVFLDRFAVRIAGVVDPTRFVPADLGVDDVGAIVDPKKKCVRTVHLGRNTFPRDAATRVFNDTPALSDGSGRENTPTVNSRLTHLNEWHGEEARCASVNGYLLSIIESKELAKVSSSYGEAGSSPRRVRPLANKEREVGMGIAKCRVTAKRRVIRHSLPAVVGRIRPSADRQRGNASDQLRRKKK